MLLVYDHYIFFFSAGIVFRRHNLTSKDGPHAERVEARNTVPYGMTHWIDRRETRL